MNVLTYKNMKLTAIAITLCYSETHFIAKEIAISRNEKLVKTEKKSCRASDLTENYIQ